MLDKHTARALVTLGHLSFEQYLRLFGEEIRSGRKARNEHDSVRAGSQAGKAPATSRPCAGPRLPDMNPSRQ